MCVQNAILAPMTIKKKPGRPPRTNGHSARLPSVRISKDELAEYKQAAEREGVAFGAWVRSVLNRAIGRK